MPKKNTQSKQAQKLSKEAIEKIEHFFWCCPPKYFSRNLRSLVVDWMERNDDGPTFFQQELFLQLILFFPILDLIEDEGKFTSEDYDTNWGHKPGP